MTNRRPARITFLPAQETEVRAQTAFPLALRATAYHEAGHAVAALARGRRASFATIVPDHDEVSAGHCEMPWPDGFDQYDDDARRIGRDRLIANVAAREAQEIATGTDHGDGGDQVSFIDIAEGLGCGRVRIDGNVWDYSRAETRYRAYARRLLEAYWPAVEAVASGLLGSLNLYEDQIRRLADEAQAAAGGPPVPPLRPNPRCEQCGARLLGQGSGEEWGHPDCCPSCAFQRASQRYGSAS